MDVGRKRLEWDEVTRCKKKVKGVGVEERFSTFGDGGLLRARLGALLLG